MIFRLIFLSYYIIINSLSPIKELKEENENYGKQKLIDITSNVERIR